MPKGKVKWFDKNKRYGFIKTEDGYDICVHVSSVNCNGSKTLYKDEDVTFEVGSGEKGPMAVNVIPSGVTKSRRNST